MTEMYENKEKSIQYSVKCVLVFKQLNLKDWKHLARTEWM